MLFSNIKSLYIGIVVYTEINTIRIHKFFSDVSSIFYLNEDLIIRYFVCNNNKDVKYNFDDSKIEYIRSTNIDYEFSGYQSLVHHFSSSLSQFEKKNDTFCLIVNDTIFYGHSMAHVLKSISKIKEKPISHHSIYGIRRFMFPVLGGEEYLSTYLFASSLTNLNSIFNDNFKHFKIEFKSWAYYIDKNPDLSSNLFAIENISRWLTKKHIFSLRGWHKATPLYLLDKNKVYNKLEAILSEYEFNKRCTQLDFQLVDIYSRNVFLQILEKSKYIVLKFNNIIDSVKKIYTSPLCVFTINSNSFYELFIKCAIHYKFKLTSENLPLFPAFYNHKKAHSDVSFFNPLIFLAFLLNRHVAIIDTEYSKSNRFLVFSLILLFVRVKILRRSRILFYSINKFQKYSLHKFAHLVQVDNFKDLIFKYCNYININSDINKNNFDSHYSRLSVYHYSSDFLHRLNTNEIEALSNKLSDSFSLYLYYTEEEKINIENNYYLDTKHSFVFANNLNSFHDFLKILKMAHKIYSDNPFLLSLSNAIKGNS